MHFINNRSLYNVYFKNIRIIYLSRGQKRAFTTQGSLNTSLIIESCTLSIFPQQHNRIEFGVSSLANKLHLANKNHTMRNSRRLARYKAHGFFLATRRHWDALTKHAGRINYKMEWNGLGKQKNVLLLRIGLNTVASPIIKRFLGSEKSVKISWNSKIWNTLKRLDDNRC